VVAFGIQMMGVLGIHKAIAMKQSSTLMTEALEQFCHG
jgi:hypothetical protein